MTYPPNWPSCGCGQPLLDGHLTCGEASCSESDARDRQARQAAARSLWICRGCGGACWSPASQVFARIATAPDCGRSPAE